MGILRVTFKVYVGVSVGACNTPHPGTLESAHLRFQVYLRIQAPGTRAVIISRMVGLSGKSVRYIGQL